MNDKDLKCHCGKLIGKVRNGKLYLYCKQCKQEIEVEITFEPVKKIKYKEP